MKKMEKNTNKGFSLVELIIVIAIMVVLVALLAPQFLKFVEKSKKSTDMQNVDSIVTAVEVYAIDPDKETDLAGTGTVTLSKDGVAAEGDGYTDALTAAGIDGNKTALKSTKWGADSIVLTFKYTNATGKVEVKANIPAILTDGKVSTK